MKERNAVCPHARASARDLSVHVRVRRSSSKLSTYCTPVPCFTSSLWTQVPTQRDVVKCVRYEDMPASAIHADELLNPGLGLPDAGSWKDVVVASTGRKSTTTADRTGSDSPQGQK